MKKSLLVVAMACVLLAPATAIAQHQIFDTVNGAIAASGRDDVQLAVVEWITDTDEVGQTVFFNDRGNKQLSGHWVPNDPRNGNGAELPWLMDFEFTADIGALDQVVGIANAMQTWQDQNCSDIPLVDLGFFPGDYGYVQFLLGAGGTPGFFPFLTHAGWLPAGFFDLLAPNGSNSILAVTFTLVWVDADGPTDIDSNGKDDVALREIYYNDNFNWGDGTGGTVDIETIALHEVGHGLSQQHFGKLSRTDKNGKFHFAPRAVMNAGYTGPQRDLAGTDNGGHCSIWGSWPNN